MLSIRMQRTGRSGHAQYRLIVQDSRFSPTSGRVVAFLGSYDPHTKQAAIDGEKVAKYLSTGAQPSDRAAKLLQKEGIKLPNWVKISPEKSRKIRNPEKLRRNRPPEAPQPESSAENAEPEQSKTEEPAVEKTESAANDETESTTETSVKESETVQEDGVKDDTAKKPETEPVDETPEDQKDVKK